MNSASLGKTIFFGLGPAFYLGLWFLSVSQTSLFEHDDGLAFLARIILLIVLSFSMSFLTFRLNEHLNVPAMKRNGVYHSHRRSAPIYSLLIAIPANSFGLMNVPHILFYQPGAISGTILLYVLGWLFGAIFGLVLGYIFLAFAFPIVKMVLSALLDTACTKEDQRV